MPYNFIPQRIYRMPTHFGPSPSPRSAPDGSRFDWSEMEAMSVSVTLESTASAIEDVLPEGFHRLGDPTVSVAFAQLRKLPWLAGRGYNILGVRTPAQLGDAKGELQLVLWENMADPIITGREELGVNKIYCELPDVRRFKNEISCEASWLGHQFFSLKVTNIKTSEPPVADPETTGQLIHLKYFPKTEEWGGFDVNQVTLTPPPQGGELLSSEAGEAEIWWSDPSWEEMPTQYQIVKKLREIAAGKAISCSITHARGLITDHYDQKVIHSYV